MPETKKILVIDNGLTVIKAAIVDSSGQIVDSCSVTNSVLDSGCFSEMDPHVLWDKTAKVIKEVILKSKVNPANIAAIGNTGFGAGIFLIDSKGSAIGNAVTSMDSRASDFIASSIENQNIFFKKTKTHMWSAQAIPLLYWFKQNEPGIYKKINKILQVKDYIKFKLTGQYSTDFTDAGNAGLVNLKLKSYDTGLYKHFGLQEIPDFLPSLIQCDEISGHVTNEAAKQTGLSKGTPVMGGLMDVVACAAGSGLENEEKYSIISGTWNINTALNKEIVENKAIMSCFLYADSKKYFLMDASPTSAVNLEWFLKSVIEKTGNGEHDRNNLYKIINSEISKRINKDPVKDSKILYFPFIYKSKLVNNLMGSFFGINASDDAYDLIYAIYQGVAFAHLLHLENLKKGGMLKKVAVLSGGASNSELWCQVFADILDLEIQTVSVKEVGLLGTAISVFMGLEGMTMEDAIKRMVTIKSVYKPDKKKRQAYLARFKKFKDIISIFENTNL